MKKMLEFYLDPVKTYGNLTVYLRKNARAYRLPRYVVYNELTEKQLEEFTTLEKAKRWAKDNS